MSYRNPSSATNHGHTLAAAGLIGITTLVAAGIAYAVWANQPPELDARTGCPLGVVPAHHVTVGIDLTDPIRDTEMGVIQTEIDKRAAALPSGSRLTIVGLAPKDGKATFPIFDRCKPKQGAEVSEWKGNKQMTDDAYESEFAKPFKEAVAKIDATEKHGSSPIIQGLADIATEASFATAKQRTLIVASDFIENGIVNMYRPPYDFAKLKEAGFKPVRDLEEALKGVEVTLLQIRAKEVGQFQTPAHRTFWLALMSHAGVDNKNFRYDRL